MSYLYYENVIAICLIFMVAYYIQKEQPHNWIVSLINLLSVSYMAFTIENELMLQVMIFFINFVNSCYAIFSTYNAKRSERSYGR